jgi:hypothetical protein
LPIGSLCIFSDSEEVASHLKEQIEKNFSTSFSRLRKVYIRNEAELLEALECAQPGNLLIYAFTHPLLSLRMKELSKKKSIPALDAFEPTLRLLKLLSESPTRYRAEIWQRVWDDYFKRLEAMEFAARHDDGQNPSGWKYADVVIIGVSRTSKTPLAFYLANRGLKVANVPIIYGVEPVRELYDLPRRKLIGLTISPARLVKIRKERSANSGVFGKDYVSLTDVSKEVEYSEKIMKEMGIPVIDVTRKAIEEMAEEILSHLGKEVSHE